MDLGHSSGLYVRLLNYPTGIAMTKVLVLVLEGQVLVLVLVT